MPTQTTVLTSAQIATLYSTSVQLNLRPSEVVGPNQVLVLHRAFLTYNPGSTQFGLTGTPLLGIQYNSGIGFNQPCSDNCRAGGLIDQTMPTRAHLRGIGCVLPNGVSTLYLASNASSAFTGGTGASMTVTIEYSVQG